MTYQSNESAGIKPIEGFRFQYESEVWLFSPEPTDVTIAGLTFLSEPSARSNLSSSNETGSNEIEVTLRRTHPMVVRFDTMDPNKVFSLTIYRGHLGGTITEYAKVFAGDVLSLERSGSLATFTVASVKGRFDRNIPRYLFQSQCNHQTYGPLCRLDRADFTVTTVLGDSGPYWGIEGRIAAAEVGLKPNGYYDGGTLTWTDPATGETHRRQIVNSSAGASFFYLRTPMPASFSPPTGLTVDMTAGDDHTFKTCNDKFSNTENYGGFPYMKTRDPQHGIL